MTTEQTPTREWWPRYSALLAVVDYLDREARVLLPPRPQDPDEQWLELIVRMKQFTPVQGPVVSRSIYSPPLSRRPSDLPDIVRQLTWDAGNDRRRVKDDWVTWPNVAVDYFQLTDKPDWERVDTCLRLLEQRFGRFPFDKPETPGLWITRQDYNPDPDIEHKRLHRVSGRKKYARALYLQLSWGVLEAAFREGQDSDFDKAWDQLWDALTQACRPNRRVDGYEPRYLIEPQTFSECVVRAANDKRPDRK